MFGVKPHSSVAKPYGQSKTTVTASLDMALPPSPIPGQKGERRMRELTAGGRFASLQAPKGEGARAGSRRTDESGLCHPQHSTDMMLGKPKPSVSPVRAKVVPAQGSSATGLAQQKCLRAKTIQHHSSSGKRQEWLITAMNRLVPAATGTGRHWISLGE